MKRFLMLYNNRALVHAFGGWREYAAQRRRFRDVARTALARAVRSAVARRRA